MVTIFEQVALTLGGSALSSLPSTSAVLPAISIKACSGSPPRSTPTISKPASERSSQPTGADLTEATGRLSSAPADEREAAGLRGADPLDGSTSADPAGEPLTFDWTAPAGITLSAGTSSKPSFTAPTVDSQTTYEFTLTVTNIKGDQATDTVLVMVSN